MRAGPLRVGNATYPDAYYAVLTDLRRYGYDVVFGADVLASTGIEIDGAAHVVRFGTPIAQSRIAVPLSFENFVPVVTVGLGDVETSLAVDTGDESNINLTYDFYGKHPGLFNVTQRRFVSGIGGSSVEMIGADSGGNDRRLSNGSAGNWNDADAARNGLRPPRCGVFATVRRPAGLRRSRAAADPEDLGFGRCCGYESSLHARSLWLACRPARRAP